MSILIRLAIATTIVLALSYLIKGVEVDKITTAIIVAIVMGLLNTFLKPILIFFTFPVTIITLGLFLLVINACMVLLCDKLVDGFSVDTFWTALLFSVCLSILQSIVNGLVKDKSSKK
jgi:putative membrane protein